MFGLWFSLKVHGLQIGAPFEVPATCSFPQVNLKCGKGVSSPEVTLATRAFFQVKHPTKLKDESGEVHECA